MSHPVYTYTGLDNFVVQCIQTLSMIKYVAFGTRPLACGLNHQETRPIQIATKKNSG